MPNYIYNPQKKTVALPYITSSSQKKVSQPFVMYIQILEKSR